MRYIYIVLMLISFNAVCAGGNITFIGNVTEKPCNIVEEKNKGKSIECPGWISTVSNLRSTETLINKRIILKNNTDNTMGMIPDNPSYTVVVEYM